MSDAEPTPEERAAGLAAWSPDAAASFCELASELGFQLDYSPDSFREVERMILEEVL